MTSISSRLRAVTIYFIVPVVVCLAFAFTVPCTLTLDGHGNAGDETTTIALSSLPAFGYHPDGSPWTWSINTAPMFSVIYTAVVRTASPFERIAAARLVSRVLGALGLYFIAIAFARLSWRAPLSLIPSGVLFGSLAFAAVALLNAPRFRFIASFARVDIVGFAFLAMSIAVASQVVVKPRWHLVFLFVLLSLAVEWTSYIAFYLVCFIAIATIAAATVEIIAATPGPGVLKRLLFTIVIPSCVAALLFAVMSRALHGSLFSGPPAFAAETILAKFVWSPVTREQQQVLERVGPQWFWFGKATLIGLLAVCVKELIQTLMSWNRNDRSIAVIPRLVRDLVILCAAVVALPLVYRLWLVMISAYAPIRFTYDSMILLAYTALQLIVFGAILRRRAADRYIMAAVVAWGFFWSGLYPWARPGEGWNLCREELTRDRTFWPVSRAMVGLYNPFDDHDVTNQPRRAHGEAVSQYLRQQGVSKALATDPMFSTLSGPGLSFVFLNDVSSDSKAMTSSPHAEETMLDEFVSRQGIHYVVSTELGESEAYESAGFAALRSCLRRASETEGTANCTFGARSVTLTRVFRTDVVIPSPAKYQFASASSTPISVYSIATLP